MIVLDTNIVSEYISGRPAPTVLAWRSRLAPSEPYLTAITRAELRCGVANLPPGRRRDELGQIVATYVDGAFDRTLPFDSAAADHYGEIVAQRRRAGRPISHPDAQIAAIARAHGAAVATRNVKDFEGTGVKVVNPFDFA